ncbi:MAG TPA: hypothetical protein PKJ97_04020 [Candidatus Bilamarchaeaceae archaeon]|nr:hypothetical protein [Candidatus Bilamarchaeaceae archaeon]
MGSKIGNEKIMREDGYLYFVGKDGFVWRVPMKHNRRGSKKKVGTQKVEKKKGHLYYVGDDGYVYQAKMKNA